VALVSQFSQHEASTLLSDIFLGSLLQVFTVVRITYVVGNSVSEEYSKLSEDEVVCSVRTVCIPDCLALVCRDTISMLFGVENKVMKWRCKIRYEILAFGG